MEWGKGITFFIGIVMLCGDYLGRTDTQQYRKKLIQSGIDRESEKDDKEKTVIDRKI